MEQDLVKLRQKTLEAQIRLLRNKFGDDFIRPINETPKIEAIKTRLFSLNLATGIGGIPKGKIIEIVGKQGSGKSTLGLTLLADAQKQGMNSVFVDLEQKFNPEYAKAIGVSDDVLLISPFSGSVAMESIDTLLDANVVDLILVDSVANLTATAELERAVTDDNVAMIARLMSQGMRRFVPKAAQSKCSIIFINQYREQVGMMYGNPEKSTGGKALQYASILKLELRDGEKLKEKSHEFGKEVKIKCAKNQVGPPNFEIILNLVYGKGFDAHDDVFSAAVKSGILVVNGSWIMYNERSLAQGKKSTVELLKQDEALYNEIWSKLEVL